MKTKLMLLVMLFIPILFGCSKETQMKKELIGKWYNSFYGYWTIFYGNPMWKETNYDKTDTPELLIFNKNGTYERIYRSSEEPVNGEWTMNNDCSEITFIVKNENGFINSQSTATISIYEGVMSISYDNYNSVRQYQKY